MDRIYLFHCEGFMADRTGLGSTMLHWDYKCCLPLKFERDKRPSIHKVRLTEAVSSFGNRLQSKLKYNMYNVSSAARLCRFLAHKT